LVPMNMIFAISFQIKEDGNSLSTARSIFQCKNVTCLTVRSNNNKDRVVLLTSKPETIDTNPA